MTDPIEIRNAIIDTAVTLAAQKSWEAVRLYDVATALNLSLDQIRPYFHEKEDLVDAWFDRADSAMLKQAEAAHFYELSAEQRIFQLIMGWLDALSNQRKVTRQMILGKLEFGHLHIQIPGIMRISRTVQWIREAAHRDATSVQRALEESALTTVYLMTFIYWMQDDSLGSTRTQQFLKQRLQQAFWVGELFFAKHHTDSSRA